MDSNQWDEFCVEIASIFQKLKSNNSGDVATYIPQLAKINPDLFGISVFSIDGQTFNIGDTSENFCIQSCSKTLTYAVALRDHGVDKIGEHIGREPSGARFNAFVFDDDNKPFNPLINSGAIMAASLIKGNHTEDERFEYIVDIWKSIVGKNNVGFDNPVYLSEKRSANRNHALAHIMMENDIFPENTNINTTLELYFQLCSITMNSQSLAKYAAMLANGGTTVDTNVKIFDPIIIRDLLCIMYTSGMYDYSGRWSFDIGLPSKSGVSGSIFAVIPNVGGICVYSPKLDKLGNSVKGVEFFKMLTKKYKLHIFDTLISGLNHKKSITKQSDDNIDMIFSACKNDDYVYLCNKLYSLDYDIDKGDYDNRRPIHIASDDNSYKAVYALLQYGANYRLMDRWQQSLLTKIITKKDNKIASCFLLHFKVRILKYNTFEKFKTIVNTPGAL
jgi:glutaminase